LEYVDKYIPYKYGIIFKEKVVAAADNLCCSINVRLKGEEGWEPRLFYL